MIVVDENIQSEHIIGAITAWYTGRVISITELRPATLIKDDGIAMLLRQVTQPTFVTINADDFWLRFRSDPRCCIVAFARTQAQSYEVPNGLRRLLSLAEFHTKAARMGKVIHVMPTYIEYYAADRQIQRIAWADSL